MYYVCMWRCVRGCVVVQWMCEGVQWGCERVQWVCGDVWWVCEGVQWVCGDVWWVREGVWRRGTPTFLCCSPLSLW